MSRNVGWLFAGNADDEIQSHKDYLQFLQPLKAGMVSDIVLIPDDSAIVRQVFQLRKELEQCRGRSVPLEELGVGGSPLAWLRKLKKARELLCSCNGTHCGHLQAGRAILGEDYHILEFAEYYPSRHYKHLRMYFMNYSGDYMYSDIYFTDIDDVITPMTSILEFKMKDNVIATLQINTSDHSGYLKKYSYDTDYPTLLEEIRFRDSFTTILREILGNQY